jgi:hypothetical protein
MHSNNHLLIDLGFQNFMLSIGSDFRAKIQQSLAIREQITVLDSLQSTDVASLDALGDDLGLLGVLHEPKTRRRMLFIVMLLNGLTGPQRQRRSGVSHI